MRTLCSSDDLPADTVLRPQVKHAVCRKMSFHVGGTAELEPAPSSVTSKVLKRFGFKVFYDHKDVRNVANETVICHHCF